MISCWNCPYSYNTETLTMERTIRAIMREMKTCQEHAGYPKTRRVRVANYVSNVKRYVAGESKKERKKINKRNR